MICDEYAGGLTICREPMKEIRRDSEGMRWCFKCRKQREFFYIVMAPVGFSYYDPNPGIECGKCGLTDGDLFPGRIREWE